MDDVSELGEASDELLVARGMELVWVKSLAHHESWVEKLVDDRQGARDVNDGARGGDGEHLDDGRGQVGDNHDALVLGDEEQ